MNIGKISLFSFSSVMGLGVPATIGSYYKSYSNIWDVVREKALPDQDSLEEDWELLRINLSSISEKLFDEKLNEIKNKSREQKNSSNNDLKEWCSKAYHLTYKSWFQEENKVLRRDVESACTLTIKIKLGGNFLDTEGTNSKSDFETNLSILKTHGEENLNDFLRKLKSDIKDIKHSTENYWERLRDWCKEVYETSYQGIKSDTLKLAEKFCKKSG